MDEVLKRDQNHIVVLGAVTDNASQNIVMLRVDPATKRLLVSATGSGTGGVNTEIPTGTVDGSNLIFSFTTSPKAVSIDGLLRRATKGYTLSGSGPYTVTVDSLTPPVYDIFSIY